MGSQSSNLSSKPLFSLSVITKFRCISMIAEQMFRLPDSGIIMAFSSRGPQPNVNCTVTFNYTRVSCRSRDRGRGMVKGKGGRRGEMLQDFVTESVQKCSLCFHGSWLIQATLL